MPGERRAGHGAVIVVSSHVARGSVGNRAAVFALETLGFPVWAVPTVVLPWHPGHGPGTRIVPQPQQFATLMADLAGAPWLGEVRAVLSGYLGDAAQAAPVAALVEAVKRKNPEALYLCDPVIGDRSGLYVPVETAEATRDRLLPLADIATPNRYELGWLTGAGIDNASDLVAAAGRLAAPEIIVTSAPATHAGSIGNLLVAEETVLLAEHRIIEKPPNGLGDLTAAVYLARTLSGAPAERALQSATATVYEILARTVGRGADELTLETDAASLSSPMALVHMHRLSGPGGGHVA